MKNDHQTLQLQYAYRQTMEIPYGEQCNPVANIIRNLSQWAIPQYPQQTYSDGFCMYSLSMLVDDVIAWCQLTGRTFLLTGDKVAIVYDEDEWCELPGTTFVLAGDKPPTLQGSNEEAAAFLISSLLSNHYDGLKHSHDPIQILRELEHLIDNAGGLAALIRYRFIMLASLALEVAGHKKDTRDTGLYARAAAMLPEDIGGNVSEAVNVAAQCLHEASQQLFLK